MIGRQDKTRSYLNIAVFLFILGIVAIWMCSGCVHVVGFRTGRAPLENGEEGYVHMYEKCGLEDLMHSQALLAAKGYLVNTTERREKHLRRRASLMGCDFLCEPYNDGEWLSAHCIIYPE